MLRGHQYKFARLKSLADKKTPAAGIAKKLKRSEGATRQKASASGCHWTRELDARLQICLMARERVYHFYGAIPEFAFRLFQTRRDTAAKLIGSD